MASTQLELGIALQLFGTVGGNFGMNIQKLSHIRNASQAPEDRKIYLKQKLWWLGLCLFVSSQLLEGLALGFGSQAVLSCIGTVSLCSNAVLARVFFGEHFGWREFWATLSILLGAACAVFFVSNDRRQDFTLSEIGRLAENPAFLCFAGVLAAVGTVSLILYMRHPRVRDGTARGSMLIYVAITVCCATTLNLLTKVVAQILKATLGGDNQFRTPVPYILIPLTVLFALSAVHCLNMALQRFDAVILVPTYYVLNLIMVVTGGILMYQEQRYLGKDLGPLGHMGPDSCLAMFGAGIGVCCMGVYMLGQREAGTDNETEICVVNDSEPARVKLRRNVHMLQYGS